MELPGVMLVGIAKGNGDKELLEAMITRKCLESFCSRIAEGKGDKDKVLKMMASGRWGGHKSPLIMVNNMMMTWHG